MNAQEKPTGSAYFHQVVEQEIVTRTLSVVVDNEPGVLARVIGLFSGRGYNIESLTVYTNSQSLNIVSYYILDNGFLFLFSLQYAMEEYQYHQESKEQEC